jgi:hypothetical protein
MIPFPTAAVVAVVGLHVGAREDELDELDRRLTTQVVPLTPTGVLEQFRTTLAELRAENGGAR